jgi:hypothetical protein
LTLLLTTNREALHIRGPEQIGKHLDEIEETIAPPPEGQR